jgi:hypothetical protein
MSANAIRFSLFPETSAATRELGRFFDSVNRQSTAAAETVSGALTGAVNGFAGALAGVATGAKSLSAAFASLAASVLGDLIQMTAKALLFRLALLPLGGALGFAQGGAVGAYATGGPIRAGTGPRADDVLIRASRGEYVVNAAAVNYYGEAFLAALNQRLIHARDLAAAIPQGVARPRPRGAYAEGGYVGAGAAAAGVSVLPAPVNVAILNDGAALRDFMERHGAAIAFDYAKKHKHELGVKA